MANIVLPYNWKPRKYQLPSWNFIERGGKRCITVWHRRAGKDLKSIHQMACMAMQRVGTYWHCFPEYAQAKKAIWNGRDKDGVPFMNAFPQEIRKRTLEQDLMVELKNGSIYQLIGADKINNLVGSNPIGVIFSEYSLMDPGAWDYIRPMLAENEGWANFIYTPRGRNHGWDLLQYARENDKWFTEILTIEDTKAIPYSAIEEERAMGMPEELIQQEFYCSFDASLVGAYYGQGMERADKEGRILNIPYDPYCKTYTFWDLGIADSTAIWVIQQDAFSFRVIDYYENSGEGLLHYIDILRHKGYKYEEHWAPHDIKVRDLSTGKSRIEFARQHGINFRVVPDIGVPDGIEAVRNILPRCYFDKEKCKRGLQALREYKKEWDDKKKCFKDRPTHDWTSHAADSFRMFAVAMRDRRMGEVKRQEYANTDYDVL